MHHKIKLHKVDYLVLTLTKKTALLTKKLFLVHSKKEKTEKLKHRFEE